MEPVVLFYLPQLTAANKLSHIVPGRDQCLYLSLRAIEMEVGEMYDRFQGSQRGIPSHPTNLQHLGLCL